MSEKLNPYSLSGKPPFIRFVVSLAIVLVIGIMLFMALLVTGAMVFNVDLASLAGATLEETGAKNIDFLRYLLIIQDLCLFIVPAIIILILIKPPSATGYSILMIPGLNDIVLVIILAVCLFPVIGFAGQLNEQMHFPQWMSGVGRWMTEKENNADSAINLLVETRIFRVMLLNVLMIGILPAIGEELIFRGIFQRIFSELFRSPHLAIWITSILFSALHLQFFGFIPRLILGLVFGYLFFWSGTLWLPVTAHFINNSVPVIMNYFVGPEKETLIPSGAIRNEITGLLLPVFACVLIMLYFRNKGRKIRDSI